MLNSEIRKQADYQHFNVVDGSVCDVRGRMAQKMDALKEILPIWEGKTVLDIGCDFGYWSFIAAQSGARVIGLDRSREVRGIGHVNLPQLNNETACDNGFNAAFVDYEAGFQWYEFGENDIVLLMSLYHHIYQNTGGDHESIWFWLSRQTKEMLLWENPLNGDDQVVKMNVHEAIRPRYNESLIREAAEKYFAIEYEGPAVHEATRTVWKLKPKEKRLNKMEGTVINGAGGASKAFVYENNRRINEIEAILNMRPIPGSMNVMLGNDFNWEEGYYRSVILDVADRSKGLDSEWRYRPIRFYPVRVNRLDAWVMRFEGEQYPLNFVELISDRRLNTSEKVMIEQWL